MFRRTYILKSVTQGANGILYFVRLYNFSTYLSHNVYNTIDYTYMKFILLIKPEQMIISCTSDENAEVPIIVND